MADSLPPITRADADEQGKIPLETVMQRDRMRGFEQVEHMPGSTYQDNSTILIIPERNHMFHWKWVQACDGLIKPMNGKFAKFYVIGDEVGVAYDRMVKHILADPTLGKWRYIMTIESDNLVPPDALIRLIEAQRVGNYAGVGGLYFTKGDFSMPMAYGDPDHFRRTGELEFRPRNILEAVKQGNIVEVNGIAMGCSLWSIDDLRDIEPPYFQTLSDVIPDKGPVGFTQDLFHCKKGKEKGKNYAVDTRVKVGHMDLADPRGEVMW